VIAIIYNVFHRDIKLLRFEDGNHTFVFDEDEEDGTLQAILDSRGVTELKHGRELHSDVEIANILQGSE
jgi:hypothetical protein